MFISRVINFIRKSFLLNSNMSYLNQYMLSIPDSLKKCCESGKKIFDAFWQPRPDQIDKYKVSLKPFRFDDQPKSKTKFNEDRLVATRIGEDDYHHAFVNLGNILQLNKKWIVIQILKVDHQHVGGVKLYLEHSSGLREILFADSNCEPYDHIIVWMNCEGGLFCKKNEIIRDLISIDPNETRHYKLVCELYGPVEQIRAYVGHLEENDNEEVVDDVKSFSEESDRNTGCSNSQCAGLEEQEPNDIPYLNLQIRRKYYFESSQIRCKHIYERITVINLHSTPPSNSDGPQSAICSGTNGSSNHTVEECKICMDAEADTIIIPCGHLAFCYECSSRVATRCGTVCPICRTKIKNWQKVHSKSDQCKNCEIHPATVVLIPCGDMCLCNSCSTSVDTCLICRMFVKSHQKVT